MFNDLLIVSFSLQEQATIGCHMPICTVSQSKLEVCAVF